MLHKRRIVAISKSDMLDEELKSAISKEFTDVQPLFFSSVAEQGLVELRDVLWKAINDEIT
jgi:GTP-binding protein